MFRKKKEQEVATPDLFLKLAIFTIVSFVIFINFIITGLLKTKDYVKVEATIVELNYVVSEEQYESKLDHIKIEYKYNNQKYEQPHRVLLRFNKKVGDIIKISVDPKDPNQIKDIYVLVMEFVFASVMLLLSILLIKVYKKHRVKK